MTLEPKHSSSTRIEEIPDDSKNDPTHPKLSSQSGTLQVLRRNY